MRPRLPFDPLIIIIKLGVLASQLRVMMHNAVLTAGYQSPAFLPTGRLFPGGRVTHQGPVLVRRGRRLMLRAVCFLGRVVHRPRIANAPLALDLADCIMGEGRPRLENVNQLSFHFRRGTSLRSRYSKIEEL